MEHLTLVIVLLAASILLSIASIVLLGVLIRVSAKSRASTLFYKLDRNVESLSDEVRELKEVMESKKLRL